VAVMANGRYSFKGSGYVRGGIFDRVRVLQDGNDISFRDLDYYRLSDVYAEGMPRFGEMAIFIIRSHYEFNPAAPFALQLVVKRQTGPLTSTFVSFNSELALGAPYAEPAVYAEPQAEPEGPLWVQIWHQRAFQITILSLSLALLFAIMFLQDWLVRYPRFLHNLRRIFLVYTVGFIGWYGLAQLSVVNVLTFVHALMSDFRWELFLSDPMLFILWSFTAATILLWGRGVFCGWLCPFGALQELINEAARKLKIRQFELPFYLHERLWAVKYLILLGLFGISLQSMAEAERFAEVEPFKTSIMLMFQREWWFVLYAVLLLVVNIFTRKVYCRYVCPLGAALAIPSRFQIFQWLRRRKECGQPCQLCKVECEIQAIHPDGHINTQECHYCLDCQMTYHNPNKCPPLINKARRARKAQPAGDRIPAVELETAS
ncbi:MAG: 4Fe-4S binding protein, partial [Gammaproteobacteria bacterium]